MRDFLAGSQAGAGDCVGGENVLGTPAAGFALPVEPGTGGAGVVGEGIREGGLRARHCRKPTQRKCLAAEGV